MAASRPTTATTRTASCAKQDGTYTYFVPDVAYHIAKWERGFHKVVNIQGTDHHGTIARVRAGLQAAGEGIPDGLPPIYVLHTMVRVMKGGEEVKISKRAGSYVTLRDLIEWTSTDAVRFFLLSRKPDTEYTFDVDLAVTKNNDNPVYYVQYAHARICSVLAGVGWRRGHAQGRRPVAARKPGRPGADAAAGQVPGHADGRGEGLRPHDVTFYLRELAASYHSYYDAERILVDDEKVKLARLGAGRRDRAGAAQWPRDSRRQCAEQDVNLPHHEEDNQTTRQHRHRPDHRAGARPGRARWASRST